MSMKIFGAVGRGPRTSLLDFGGYPSQCLDPRFLNLIQKFFMSRVGGKSYCQRHFVVCTV